MPGRDKTGPNKKGPMTGKKLGPCNKDAKSEPLQYGQGCRRGFGQRFGQNTTQETNAKE